MIKTALPTLYCLSSAGKLRQWRSWSEGDQVYTEYGDVGGKLQTSSDTAKGKNQGRSNETTPEQQAELMTQQLHTKKVKEGYVTSMDKAKKGDTGLGGPEAMLAHTWEDYADKVTFPAFAQPKLDGIRCLVQVIDGKVKLWTRSHKEITTVPHINEAYETFVKEINILTITFDGELYNHSLKDDFGEILSVVKRGSTREGASIVQHHMYDIVDPDLTFAVRQSCINQYCRKVLSKYNLPIKEVHTKEVRSTEDLIAYQLDRIEKGYEGAMYRASESRYEGKRSKGLLKVKTFKDSEFQVTDYQEGNGKLQGKVGSFTCKTDKGVFFNAKLVGELDKLPSIASGKKYVGKTLTVKYQGLTADGAPRFPVALKFKDEVEG